MYCRLMLKNPCGVTYETGVGRDKTQTGSLAGYDRISIYPWQRARGSEWLRSYKIPV